MNACGRYLGSVRSATLVRSWRPISATSEPSRARICVDWGCGTMRHASLSCAASGAASARARSTTAAALARRRAAGGRMIDWPSTDTDLQRQHRRRTRGAARTDAQDTPERRGRSVRERTRRRHSPGERAPNPLPPLRSRVQLPGMPAPLHLALAQFRPRKGDYAANVGRLRDVFAQVATLEPRPAVLHLPETALTGYFVEGGVRDLAVTAGTLARDLDAAYRSAVGDGQPLDLVVGFYELFESTLYNSAMYVTVGGGDGAAVRHVHRKNFLPTYGL